MEENVLNFKKVEAIPAMSRGGREPSPLVLSILKQVNALEENDILCVGGIEKRRLSGSIYSIKKKAMHKVLVTSRKGEIYIKRI